MFNPTKNTPIRGKLMRIVLLTCSLVLVLMCAAYLLIEYSNFKSNIKNDVSTLGIIIASNSSAALAFDSPQDATEVLDALRANKHIVSACLFNNDGMLFARYPATASAQSFPVKPRKSGYRYESGYLIGFQPVMQNTERMGTLFIKCDLAAMYAQIRHILLVAVLLIAGSLVVAYFISRILQKSISGPIMALEQTAKVISKSQNYSIRAVKMSDDEIGSLTDAFNQMLAQLEKQNIEIRQSEEASSKLAAIVESSNDAIIGHTLAGIITSWNNSAERMFGYTADEMIGQSVNRLTPADRLDEGKQIMESLNNGERIENFETQRLDKYNRAFYASISISPVKDARHNTVGLSKIVRDISEKKQEELRKNDFVAIVSHELKTPLTSIKAYIQLLLLLAKKEDAGSRINSLTKVDTQIRKMTNMVHDFLSLARLEGGVVHLDKVPFELQPFIEELVNEATLLTLTHKIKYNGCGHIMIYGDRDKIAQVMTNLISNAIKYDPSGGDITIGCVQMNDKVRISVKDQGVGISQMDQVKLFDRFYRVKNEKVKTVSGFGIGLYLVSTIISYHNSSIQVDSEEGNGSTFYFDMDIV